MVDLRLASMDADLVVPIQNVCESENVGAKVLATSRSRVTVCRYTGSDFLHVKMLLKWLPFSLSNVS